MKMKQNILGLLLVLMFTLASCGGDDKKVALPVSKEIPYMITIEVAGIEGTTTPPLVNVTLDSIIGKENARNLSPANEQNFQRGKSYFGVYGLKNVSESAILQNFTITIGNNTPVNLGSCSPSGITGIGFLSETDLSDDKYTNIIKALFDELIVKKSSTVKISYDANQDISRDQKVLFKLYLNGIYKYNTYPD
ncbi:hypothetical protein [Parabacteroides sp. Marseille-P3160]|uniref:hypothetical protein n=1 Tax=Parabacteroides sp. Marseille-P3160 TaxID=1917887 RepID=UPI0009BC2BE7|nr:hypothetical protein [Parabacteroides sp. Marseille-P3160]